MASDCNHRIQLAAYALLVEENLARPVPIAFVYLVPSRQLVTVPIGAKEREEVIRAIAEMRRVIEQEKMPEPDAGPSAMRRVRIPQLLCGHLVRIFAKGGRFDAIQAVAKNYTGIRRAQKPRFFEANSSGFKPIPDEEGTETSP